MDKILTVTLNPALDVTTSVPHLEPHVKLRCESPLREPGGGGINVSRMIRILGGESCAFLAIGGKIGEHLRQLTEDAGVPTHAFPAPGMTRETLQVVERSSGNQYRFVMPGPEWDEALAADAETEIARAIERVGYSWVVGSGSLPPGMPGDFFARLARRAADAGARFVLDSSGEALLKGIEGAVFLVKPDRQEIADLAAALGGGAGSEEETALQVVRYGSVDAMIYTRGADGAVLVTGEEILRWRPPAVEIKSLTGAGDSFLAAAIVALARGETFAAATRWGVAAAAGYYADPAGYVAATVGVVVIAYAAIVEYRYRARYRAE